MPSLRIKVVPGSSRTRVEGWLGEALKVRVTAKPEKGRANEAVISLLAQTLKVPKKNISIFSGAWSAMKVVEVADVTESEILARLPARKR
jgi:uncharacterized protein (TIGR00251 family)